MHDWQPLDTAPMNVEVQVYFHASAYVGLAVRYPPYWQGKAGHVEPTFWRPKPTKPTAEATQ